MDNAYSSKKSNIKHEKRIILPAPKKSALRPFSGVQVHKQNHTRIQFKVSW